MKGSAKISSSSLEKEYDLLELKNDIRVVHKFMPHAKIAHCGFILDIGSRDESVDLAGIAHFWEHMAFKGTKHRKAYHIINRLESVGGELNAYTTKEKICFYASFMSEHYEKAIELLADITFNSIFPEKEIEKERRVILEEMAMYVDIPEDGIHDEFETLVFGKHGLGGNILGTEESIQRIQRSDFQTFLQERLDTKKIVFSSIGNVPTDKVNYLAEKYFGDVPKYTSNHKRKLFKNYKPKHKTLNRAFTQSHCVIGRDAYSLMDDKRLTFFMLTNILGGPGMNSRLNLSLREKYGLVYNVEASYTSFVDTGLFEIYFGTEKKHLEKSLSLVLKEIKKMREVQLGSLQLSTYKSQLIGQLAMAEESNVNLMQMMGKSILDMDTIDSLESIFEKINSITAQELRDVANELLVEEQLSFLTYIQNNGVY